MEENTFLVTHGRLPLIVDYPELKDTVATTTCELCGYPLEEHFCMVKGMSILSVLIVILIGYIWLKVEIKHYKNKKW